MAHLTLLDKDDRNKPTAIIITEHTTAEELQRIIDEEVHPVTDYNSDVLEAALPDDCTIYWVSEYNDTIIW